jgi:hypothetical protein
MLGTRRCSVAAEAQLVTDARQVAPVTGLLFAQNPPHFFPKKYFYLLAAHVTLKKKTKQIGDHALPERGFGLSTPSGAERKGGTYTVYC